MSSSQQTEVILIRLVARGIADGSQMWNKGCRLKHRDNQQLLVARKCPTYTSHSCAFPCLIQELDDGLDEAFSRLVKVSFSIRYFITVHRKRPVHHDAAVFTELSYACRIFFFSGINKIYSICSHLTTSTLCVLDIWSNEQTEIIKARCDGHFYIHLSLLLLIYLFILVSRFVCIISTHTCETCCLPFSLHTPHSAFYAVLFV